MTLKKSLGSCSQSPQPPFQISQLWLETPEESRVESGVLTHIRVPAPEPVYPGCITTQQTTWSPYCLPLKAGKSTWVLYKEQEKPGPCSIMFPDSQRGNNPLPREQWSRVATSTTSGLRMSGFSSQFLLTLEVDLWANYLTILKLNSPLHELEIIASPS